jgi:hypothetical protein
MVDCSVEEKSTALSIYSRRSHSVAVTSFDVPRRQIPNFHKREVPTKVRSHNYDKKEHIHYYCKVYKCIL